MYVLNRDEFRLVDKNRVVPFVECWEKYYDYESYDERVYFEELNLGKDLTEQNVVRLLRWKDPRMLTHPKKSDGKPNTRVVGVLEQLAGINGFRNSTLTAEEFQRITEQIFRSGFIDMGSLNERSPAHLIVCPETTVAARSRASCPLRLLRSWDRTLSGGLEYLQGLARHTEGFRATIDESERQCHFLPSLV
ncbi:MAG: hypothetical protein IH991_19785 [Planctomycetes bacterium]|nr:hypothetical protein [Planctomycetota bacterium]